MYMGKVPQRYTMGLSIPTVNFTPNLVSGGHNVIAAVATP